MFSAPLFFHSAQKKTRTHRHDRPYSPPVFLPSTGSIWPQTIQPRVRALFFSRLTTQPHRCGRFRRLGSSPDVPGSSPDVPGSPLGAPAAGLGFINNQIARPLVYKKDKCAEIPPPSGIAEALSLRHAPDPQFALSARVGFPSIPSGTFLPAPVDSWTPRPIDYHHLFWR